MSTDRADHTGMPSVVRSDNDPLCRQNSVVMAAKLFKSEQSAFFDFSDNETDFISVGRNRKIRAFILTASCHNQIAESVNVDFVRTGLQTFIQEADHIVFKAAVAGNINQCFQKFCHFSFLMKGS